VRLLLASAYRPDDPVIVALTEQAARVTEAGPYLHFDLYD
jgi:hypothetical protein